MSSDYTVEEIDAAIEAINESLWDEDVPVPAHLASNEDYESIDEDGDYWTNFQEWERLLPLELRGEVVQPELVFVGQDPLEYTFYYVVFKVGDQLFRKTGWYQSHYGSELDGDVEPVREVVVEVKTYETVE